MRFTLAFSHNSEGLFRVTAAANPNAHKRTGFVVASTRMKLHFVISSEPQDFNPKTLGVS